MQAATRRGAIGAFCGMGLGMGMAGVLVPQLALARSPIDLPTQPLRLRRRLERSLRDGNRITVERIWQIGFARMAQGIAVTGVQIFVDVDTPPALASLAELERKRSTQDMWPVRLTASGLIHAAGSGSRGQDVEEAARIASDMIAARPIPAAQRDREIAILTQLAKAQSSLLDRMPDDLFFPTAGPLHTVRKVDLPGGLVGEFELRYEAQAVSGKGWLERARREVVTRLAGTWQSAREEWTLSDL